MNLPAEPRPVGTGRRLRTLWTGEAVVLLVSAVQSLWVAHLLDPSVFGEAALIFAFPAMVFVFLDPQSQEAVYRFAGEAWSKGDRQHVREMIRFAYVADVVLSVVGTVAMLLLASVAGRWLLDGTEGRWPLLMAATIATAAGVPNTTARAALDVLRRNGSVPVLTGLVAAARLAVVVVATHRYGLDGYVVGLVVMQCAETLVLVSAAQLAVRALTPGARTGWRTGVGGRTREVLRFMLFTDLTTLASSLVKQLDVVLLGAFRPLVDVGNYRIARNVAGLAGAALRPVQAVTFPRIAAAASDGHDALRRELSVLRRRLALPLSALALVGVALIPLFVRIALPEAYSDSTWPTVILALGSVVGIATFWMRPALLMLGAERALFWLSLAMTVSTVAGYALAAPWLGAPGVAAARVLFASFVGNYLAARMLRDRLASPAVASS